ncbi:hypothetical protein MMC25_003223 [Agyrium rufum]|nr:hypothetical protein [Agyrium rufum]
MSHPHPFKRSVTAQDARLSYAEGAHIASWEKPADGSSVTSYNEFDPAYHRGRPDNKNMVKPPYHWHWYQEEFFEIHQGEIIFNLEGKLFKKTAADGRITIPIGQRHTFQPDPDCKETCILTITTGTPSGVDERFFRNVYGYIDDCVKHGLEPSPVQMFMFLDSAEVGAGLPGPRWIANPVSWVLAVVVGRWMGWALGYKASYPEYYEEKKGL